MKNARWVRLADDLTRGITNGDYPLDSYLPTEMKRKRSCAVIFRSASLKMT